MDQRVAQGGGRLNHSIYQTIGLYIERLIPGYVGPALRRLTRPSIR